MGPNTLMASAGAITSAIGSYYQAKNQQYQMRSQASSLSHQAEMDKLNARSLEFQAETILEASQRKIGALTRRAGQVKASARTAMAGRGLALGVGSAAEIQATTDVFKEIDALTINSNAVRESEAVKMQQVGLENKALLTETNASNLLTGADTINPLGASLMSLAGSSGNIASAIGKDRKNKKRY